MKVFLIFVSVFLQSASAIDKADSIDNRIHNHEKRKATQACGTSSTKDLVLSEIFPDIVQHGEFQWMAAVAKSGTFKFRCGGSLIHPQVVLTSAHCIKNNNTYQVRIGDYIRANWDELHPHQIRDVKTVMIHPDYKPEGSLNDLALLFLEKRVSITKRVGVVLCLPESTTCNEKCVALTSASGFFSSKSIKQETIVLKASACGKGASLHESFICAKPTDQISYIDGSPLMCRICQSDRYFQAGIVSDSFRAGGESTTLFTNVQKFQDWIKQKIKENISN